MFYAAAPVRVRRQQLAGGWVNKTSLKRLSVWCPTEPATSRKTTAERRRRGTTALLIPRLATRTISPPRGSLDAVADFLRSGSPPGSGLCTPPLRALPQPRCCPPRRGRRLKTLMLWTVCSTATCSASAAAATSTGRCCAGRDDGSLHDRRVKKESRC